MVGGELRI